MSLQDHFGCLHARHLAALATAMRLALVEVYEVASFYAHFDIVMDGEPAPPALTVRVCDSLTCALFGADRLLAELPARCGPGVRVVRAPCMGGCHNAPVAALGHALHEHASLDTIAAAVARGRHPSASAGQPRLRRLRPRRRLSPAGAIALDGSARSRRS